MMRNQSIRHVQIALFIFILLLTGCTSAPIYNAKDVRITSKDSITEEEIALAIRNAAHRRGWNVEKVGKWKIKATKFIRSHVATVVINYSKNSFDIVYLDSKNLNFDGNNIHKNYNVWIHQLVESIQAELEFFYNERT